MKKLPPELQARREAATSYIGKLLPFIASKDLTIIDATRLGVRGPTKETLVNIWCFTHQQEHTVRLVQLQRKPMENAPCCTRLTKQELISKITANPNYEVTRISSSSSTVLTKDQVTIYCTKHKFSSTATVGDRLKSPLLKCCSSENAARSRESWLASIKHSKLSYSGKPYIYKNLPVRISSTTRVIVGCPDHGDKEVYAFSHLDSRLLCCTKLETADSSRHSIEHVLAALKEHSPQYKYRVLKAEGPYSEWVVEGKCRDHGVFTIDTKAKHTLSQTLRYGAFCAECTRLYMSGVEKEFSVALDQYFPNVSYRTNVWLKGFGQKRLDFYFPDAKLGVEINGTYWHSEDKKGKTAHSAKQRFLEEQGILLMQFTDSEFSKNRKLIMSMVASRLGHNKRIYARKTKLCSPTPQEAREFFLRNHISGFVPSTYYIGLQVKDRIVSIISIGKARYSKDADYELLRFATRRGFTVVGGLSKMLAELARQVKDGSLLTYADLRYGNGNAYAQVGFTRMHDTEPGFSYFKGLQLVSRQQATHKKLPYLLGDNYDPEMSQDANMTAAGWRRIYDAGHRVFLLNLQEFIKR